MLPDASPALVLWPCPLVPFLGWEPARAQLWNGAPLSSPDPLLSPRRDSTDRISYFSLSDVLGQRDVWPRVLHPPGPLGPEALSSRLRVFRQPVTAGQLQAGPLEQPGLG